MTTFIYNGETFTPLKSGQDVMLWLQETIHKHKVTYLFNTDKKNWNNDDFYRAAASVGAGKFNFFLHNGNECMPCSYGLIEQKPIES